MVITSSSQQAVLNISPLRRDSSYFAYIVTNSIGCVPLHEENAEKKAISPPPPPKYPTKQNNIKTTNQTPENKQAVFLIENPQSLSGLKNQLILSRAHMWFGVIKLFVCHRVPYL